MNEFDGMNELDENHQNYDPKLKNAIIEIGKFFKGLLKKCYEIENVLLICGKHI